MDMRLTYRGVPRRGADAAAFGEACMEFLCSLTHHWAACALLNAYTRFPHTGHLYGYFVRQSEKRGVGPVKRQPVQWTFTVKEKNS